MTFTGLLILVSGVLLMAIAGTPEVTRRMRGMFYGWFMAGLGAFIMALGTAPLFTGLPIWNPVLRNAFSWTPGQMSWAYAFTQIEGGFLGPAQGMLIDKVGPRRMVFLGLVILGSGFVLFSQIRELWHLYVVFVIMSMGATLGSWLPMMTVLNHWFVRRRTMAMSLAMEGFALGGIILSPLLAWAIGGTDPNISERYGWSTSALFIGILTLALALPLSRLVRNRPEDLGLKPDGDSAVPATASLVETGLTPSGTEEEGYTWQEAIRTATFWLMSFGHGASSMVIVAILVHLGLMLDDRGFSLQAIGAVVAVFTAFNTIFIPIGGYLGDRLPIRFVAFGFSALSSLAVVVLVLARNVEMLFLFAVLLGVGIGGRITVTTAMRGAYFGRKAFAAITGISIAPMNVLMFIAAPFAGYLRDVTGSYDIPFITIATVSFCGCCLFLLMGDPAAPPVRAARSPLAAD